MNFMRNAFITLFMLLLVVLIFYAGFQLGRKMTPWISWLGLLLAAAAPFIFLAFERFNVDLAGAIQPIGFSAVCGLGVAITMAASWRFGYAAGNTHICAGACLIGWLICLKWHIKPTSECDN